MTDAERHLADLDRALHWQRRAAQMRRLDAELALWIGKLRTDETDVAAQIVGELVARRRAVLAGKERQARATAGRERRSRQASATSP